MSERLKKIGDPVLTPETGKWGGKGANLMELAQLTRVSAGFVINSEAYDRFTDEQEIQNLEWIDNGDIDLEWIEDNPDTSLEEVQKTTQDVFLNNQLPSEYQKDIASAVQTHSGGMFTRSSAVNEDGEENSGAGRMESFGPLTGVEDILEGTKKVFASAYDEKAINYLVENNMESFGGVAVVVQEAVDPEFGGVIYSSDPSGNTDEVYMEINETPWQVVDDDIRDIIHLEKDSLGDNGDRSYRHQNNNSDAEALPSEEQVMEAARVATEIEQIYDSPMDIEFAYDQNGEMYVLQGRPITVEGYGQPEFNIPDDIQEIAEDHILAETGIVRNSGILQDKPAVVVDDAESGGGFQAEGDIGEYNEQFSDGYIIVTPVMNEDLENLTGNAEGLVASEGGKTSHASTVADENGMLYMGALDTQPQEYLEHGDTVYMAVNGHEGIFARGEDY